MSYVAKKHTKDIDAKCNKTHMKCVPDVECRGKSTGITMKGLKCVHNLYRSDLISSAIVSTKNSV